MACSARRVLLPSLLAVIALGAPRLVAQCDLAWVDAAPAAGPDGRVLAVLPLPSGEVIAGGQFRIADRAIVDNVARWDGTTWQPLGAGFNGSVLALARLANGDLVAGGVFTTSGTTALANIARWNGSSWVGLGTGLDGAVNDLLVLPNGDLLAAGSFLNAGGVAVNLVARWNGTSWSPLGAGPATQGNAFSLARRPNGEIVVGGQFLNAVQDSPLQRWDGTQWQGIPGFDPFASAQSVGVRPNGDVVASGSLPLNSVPTSIVLWNGTSVVSLQPPVAVLAAFVASNGDVWAGAQTQTSATLLRWDGSQWHSISGAPVRIEEIAEDASSRLVIGSNPILVPRERAVVRYDGTTFQALGAQKPPTLAAAVRLAGGDVVVGGTFTWIGGVAANNVARWNGTSWSPLGAGVDARVRALAATPDGGVIVAGAFTSAGGAPAARIARWDGQTWSTLGAGVPQEPVSIAAGANGDVMSLTLGTNGLRRFDGLTWNLVQIPNALIMQTVAALPNGDFAIGGVFFPPGGSLNGLTLYSSGTSSPFPGGTIPIVNKAYVDSLGRLVVGPSLRRWDGTSWTLLGGPSVATAIGELPNGDLVVGSGASVVGGGAPSSLHRLRATGWESMGDVVAGFTNAIASSSDGDLIVGGTFTTVMGMVAAGFVRAEATCPAATVVVGSGCSGGAGPVTLSSPNGAWIGGPFLATATGMTASSLALQLVGLPAPAVALPGGAPGCSLLLNPLLADVLVPSGGVATTTWTVPNDLNLVGVQLRLQVVGVELSPTSIVRLTSTNALQLTIGAL